MPTETIQEPTQETASAFLQKRFSRRAMGRVASLLGVGAALPFYNESALAQLSRVENMAPDAVKIDANENPLGPCTDAQEAIHKIVSNGGRYMYSTQTSMAQTLAEVEGLKQSYVIPFAGSSDPLHRMVLAYCSKDKPFVAADPGYEAGSRAAKFIGAKTIGVPLRKSDYAHDVKAMVAAHPTPGLIYICNPNNPTGTVTPKEEIEWAVANKPKGTIILLDEAYIHFALGAERLSPLVAQDKEVVILRTFSKLYGMAGIRAGAALGRPDLMQPMMEYAAGALPITGMVAAEASLKNKTIIAERQKWLNDTRTDVFDFLAKNNVEFIKSDANMFMMNVKRPGRAFWNDMKDNKVYVGRVWPVMPTWVRVTVGTPQEMAAFKKAFSKVYNA